MGYGCKSKPKGLLSEDKMASIIAEQKLLEAKVDQLYLRNIDSSRMVYSHLEQKIFKDHKTDSSAYNKSYNFYLSQKQTMVDILSEAEKILDKKTPVDSLSKKPE